MAKDRVREAAMAYISRVMVKTGYYLDKVRTDDEWVVRAIVVEEKERKGAAGPKRWHVLYEVHLDPDLKPLYYVRRGIWEKAVPVVPEPEEAEAEQPESAPPEMAGPAAAPAVTGGETPPVVQTPPMIEAPPVVEQAEVPAGRPAETDAEPSTGEPGAKPEGGPEVVPEARVRIGFVAPRVGDGEGKEGGRSESEAEERPTGRAMETGPAPPGPEPDVVEGAGAAAGEEAGVKMTRPEVTPTGEEMPEPAPSEDEATDEATEETTEETTEESFEEAGGLEEEDVEENGTAEAGERAGEEALTPAPPAEVAGAPGSTAGPSKPAVQEKQGPPKVRFRFVADETVRKPG